MKQQQFEKRVKFNGVKVFSATMQRDRDSLGDWITEWKRVNSQLEIEDVIVTQSSDKEFHCLSITVFYTGEAKLEVKRDRNGGERRLNFSGDRT